MSDMSAAHGGSGVLALPKVIGVWLSTWLLRRCPHCEGRSDKALYCGVPLRICRNDVCGTGWGPGADLFTLMPVSNGSGDHAFWRYDGPYPLAVASWLASGLTSDRH